MIRATITAATLALALGGGASAAPFGCAPTPPPRILIFGDSLTAGFGLAPAQGLVHVAQDWLDRHGAPARLINGGLSGDTTYGGRVRIGPAVTRHHPDAIAIELGANDMLMGWSATSARGNLDAILRRARQAGPVLLVGIDLPNAAPEWRKMWPKLAKDHNAALLPDLARTLGAQPKPHQYLQPDGLHPAASGVRLMVRDLGPALQNLVAVLDAERWDAQR